MAGNGYAALGSSHCELKKYILEEEALQYGVEIKYEAVLTGVYLNGNRISGIEWFEEATGFHKAFGRIVADATADAWVTRTYGGEVRRGRKSDGKYQPYSNIALFYGNKTTFMYNTDHGYVDPENGEDLSTQLIDSAQSEVFLSDKFNDDLFPLASTLMLGIRSGPGIVGEETITIDNIFNNNLSDGVYYCCSNMDNHSKDIAFESEAYKDWCVGASLWGLGVVVPVPLKAMIPRGFDGIIACGRTISTDYTVSHVVRMKRDVQRSGEIAGLLAYKSIKENCEIKDVTLDTEKLDYRFSDTSVTPNRPLSSWLSDIDEIKSALMSDKPGIGIWSCRYLDDIDQFLLEWLISGDCRLSKNSAVALALKGNGSGVEILRKMAKQRDLYTPKTSRKFNYPHGITAVYLLGRLKDEESVEIIKEILLNWTYGETEECAEFIEGESDYYFQYLSFGIMALIEIGNQYEHLRDEISDLLNCLLIRQNKYLPVKMKGSHNLEYNMYETVINIIKNEFKGEINI